MPQAHGSPRQRSLSPHSRSAMMIPRSWAAAVVGNQPGDLRVDNHHVRSLPHSVQCTSLGQTRRNPSACIRPEARPPGAGAFYTIPRATYNIYGTTLIGPAISWTPPKVVMSAPAVPAVCVAAIATFALACDPLKSTSLATARDVAIP